MNQKKHVLFINAAPRAGKDTLGLMISSISPLTSTIQKAAHPLYKGIQELFGLSADEWVSMYETAKETPSGKLEGLSPRNAMIWLSEDVMKPKFGKDFFGRTLARRILGHEAELHIVTDAGFVDEVRACANMLPSDEYNVMMIRLIRNGCSYEGDSREYVDPTDVGIPLEKFDIITNNGTKDELFDEATRWIKENL